jgi:hypothetical protein
LPNDILRKRVCLLLANAYAMKQEDVYNAYLKLASIDSLLNLLESGQLQQVMIEVENRG